MVAREGIAWSSPLGDEERRSHAGQGPVVSACEGRSCRGSSALGSSVTSRIADELAALRKEIADLRRRIDAVQADVEAIARTASRFGRDIELRDRAPR